MIVATSVIAAVHRGRTLLARERLAGRICIGLSAALGTAAAIAIRIDIAGGDVPTSVSVTIATLLAATLLAAMVLIMTYGAVGVLVEHSDLARAASQTAGDEVVELRQTQQQMVAELGRLRAAEREHRDVLGELSRLVGDLLASCEANGVPDRRDKTIRRLTSELDAAREQAKDRYDQGWVDGRAGKKPGPED